MPDQGANVKDSVPWYDAFPKPNATPSTITSSELLGLIRHSRQNSTAKPSYLLVDVRRNDHEGGTIATSLNLPAQSIYYSLSTFLRLVKATETVESVIFYCGSSRGRGPRCAAWFQDICNSEEPYDNVKSYVLEGGIKGWVKQGRQQGRDSDKMIDLVDGYVPGYWDQFMNEE